MSKNINFTGQPIYSQLLDLTDKQKIKEIRDQGSVPKVVGELK